MAAQQSQNETEKNPLPDISEADQNTSEVKDEGMSDAQEDQLQDDLDAYARQHQYGGQAGRRKRNSTGKRKKKTGLAAALIFFAAAVVIAGAAAAASNSSTSSNTGSDSRYDTEQVSGTYSSNTISSFEVNGTTFTMPEKVQDLEDAGWTIAPESSDEELPETVSKDDYGVYVKASKDGASLGSLRVENLSDAEEVSLGEAYITDFYFSSYNSNGLTLSLPYDVSFEETSSDVLGQLDDEGVPYRIYYYEDEITGIYMKYEDGTKTYQYEIYFNDDQVSSVSFYYYQY